MMIQLFFFLGLSCAVFLSGHVKDDIAAAEREGLVLTRQALVASWKAQEEARIEADVVLGRYAHVYCEPLWQKALRRFDGTCSVAADYSFSYLANGYDGEGDLVNSAVVRFGKQPVLSDILVASALSNHSNATPGVGYEFLQDLSGTQIPIQASIFTHECELSCLIGFAKNAFQIGVRLPLRQQFRTISIVPTLTNSMRSLLRTTTDAEPLRNGQFRDFYGVSVAAMIEDVIAEKNMIYRENHSRSSIGDISFVAAMHTAPMGVERLSWSAELLVPGERVIEDSYFYSLVPESLGCLSARISSGLIAKKTAFGSPYVSVSGQAYFSSSINYRVPRIISLTGANALPEKEVFGAELSFFPVVTLSVPETTIADFAAQITTTNVRPGFVFCFQTGSVIHPFASPLLQLDVYYRLRLQGANEVGNGLSPFVWNTSALVSSKRRAAHVLGASLVYQPTSSVLVRAGFEGVVAGRSVPVEVTVGLSVGGSF